MAAVRQGLVYGVGALRAAARGDRIVWALHRAALANGIVPVIPAMVIAEGMRTEARGDLLEALLAGSEIEVLEHDGARRLGDLAARAGTADLVATSVADCAARRGAAAVTARQSSLRAAADLLGHELVVYVV